MIKDLTINGVQYAKYAIEKEILYFKCLKNFPAYKDKNKITIESEQICINIIRDIDENKFKTVAYLNE